MKNVNEELKKAIYNYAKEYYPQIDLSKLNKEAKRVADAVLGLTCDCKSALTIIGVLLCTPEEETI
jgi:hypothetical protein